MCRPDPWEPGEYRQFQASNAIHRGIPDKSQWCTDNDCPCQFYKAGEGPYLVPQEGKHMKQRTWLTVFGKPIKRKDLKPGDSYEVRTENSVLYTVYRPPRPRGMSPVVYYRKFKVVDDNFTRRTNGRYYCNPAHCSRSWTDKKARDLHLDGAYGALG